MLILEARQKLTQQSLELSVFHAWHTARLTTYSGNKLPKLKDELDKFARLTPSRPRRQTREEMIAAMQTIRARSIH